MSDHVTIVAVVGPHVIVGALENRGLRVSDVLNDPASEFVRLQKATVCREIGGQCIEQAGEMTICKSALDFALLEHHKHESPLRRQAARIEKKSFSAFALLGNYEIRGTLMLKGSPDVIAAFNRELATFIPIINPKIANVNNSRSTISSGIAFLNKSKIAILHL